MKNKCIPVNFHLLLAISVYKGVNRDDMNQDSCITSVAWIEAFKTCSSFVHVLFFIQVHTAKTSNVKIQKLFFAYHIGNNPFSRKQRSTKPEPHSEELNSVFPQHVSVLPCTRGWQHRQSGTGYVVVWWLHAIAHHFPVCLSCFPCDWLVLFIKQLVIEWQRSVYKQCFLCITA